MRGPPTKPDPSPAFRAELAEITALLATTHEHLRRATRNRPTDGARSPEPGEGPEGGAVEGAAREILRVLAASFVGPASLTSQALERAIAGPEEGALPTLEAIYREVGEALRRVAAARGPESPEARVPALSLVPAPSGDRQQRP